MRRLLSVSLWQSAWLLQITATHPFLAVRIGAQGEPELFVNKRVV